MTLAFEKIKARLVADPKVKAEYEALAPEFEIAAAPPTLKSTDGLPEGRRGRKAR